MIRLLIFLIALITVVNTSGYAVTYKTYDITSSYEVGKSPIKILRVISKIDGSTKLHIFCAGEDLNYNHIIDEGDEKPSWWILDDLTTVPRKVLDFNTFFNYRPFRPGLDSDKDVLYVPMSDRIISLDLVKEEISNNIVAEINVAAISFFDNKLLVTIQGGTDLTGSLKVVNLITNEILECGSTSINPVESITFPEYEDITVAVLTQGKFGTDKSLLSLGIFDNKYQFIPKANFDVGNSANHIHYNAGKIYVTVNMSHVVLVCDIKTKEVESLHTGTTGWNGPRESFVVGNDLFVTTYSGDIRIFDLGTGILKDIVQSYNGSEKIENMSSWDSTSFVSTSTYDEYYTPLNTISIWNEKDNEFIESLKTLTVGSAPVGLVFDENTSKLHVFCRGNDKNGNGTAEPDDELPSWWLVDGSTNDLTTTKKAEFDFGAVKYPFRPAVDKQTKTIYIPANDYIRAYDMDNFELVDDMVSKYDAFALELAGTHLMAAVRYEDKEDSIVVINLQTGTVLQKVPAGKKVLDLKYYPLLRTGQTQPEISLAILSSNENNDQSYISYGPIKHMAEFTLNSMSMTGIGANRIAFQNNMLAVSSYFSNDSYIVDAETGSSNNVKLGTTNSKGPLTATTVDQIGFIFGTEYGDLRLVSAVKSENDNTIICNLNSMNPVGLPVETIELYINQLNNNMFLATTTAYNNGAINNEVKIINRMPTSVKDYPQGNISQIKIYPNPTSDYLTIETELRESNSNLKIEIISIAGNKVCDYNLSAGNSLNYTIDIRKIGLANGTYFARIINGNEIKSLPFNVVK